MKSMARDSLWPTVFGLLTVGLSASLSPLLPSTVAAANDIALPTFDFRRPEIAREWGRPHDAETPRPGPEGLEVRITGSDPYFFGPARDYPTNTPLWLIARLRSDEAGAAEIFYFKDGPKAGQSVQFHVPAGDWTERRVPLPSLGPAFRLRFDPPGQRGRMVLAELRFEPRLALPAPEWPAWQPPAPGRQPRLTSGPLALWSSAPASPGLELRVHEKSMAYGHPRPRAAYLRDGQVHWVDWGGKPNAGNATSGVWAEQPSPRAFTIQARTSDAHGAEWTWRQDFRAESEGTFAVATTVSVSEDRMVLFLPMHQWIAGERSFGRRKHQGLLAGLEYLDDEPSRSEADITGPEANRRIPSSYKLTFPLMAIEAEGRYVGLAWDEPAEWAALFDSPDRTYQSGGHLMGVIYPGADGANREEGSLLPYAGQTLRAGTSVRSQAWLMGGEGSSVVAAVRHYVRLRGWPKRPDPPLSFSGYVSLAARGWLHSKIREGNLYRHAFWPGFNPQPAADAAVWQHWLAGRTDDGDLAGQLRAAAGRALEVVAPENHYHSAIGHVRPPTAPLVFGSVPAAIEAARRTARAQLGRFQPDGSIPYRAAPGGVDYGRTHFAPDANGLTAQVVATLLEAAAFCGERTVITQAVDRLRALGRFRHSVPRGAQTWEVPLHTPDILASAHLVRAFTLGYELTGDRAFLEQAVEWAWTGVPFVYLTPPTKGPVGVYSTIAVFGATGWRAPVWFGRPVQWCGLVYAHALHLLAPHDPTGPWQDLANGITGAGLQHTWPAEDIERAGLLPDFYELPAQTRAGPAINPATIADGAVRLYDRGPVHDFRVFASDSIRVGVHAPGRLTPEPSAAHRIAFTVQGWPADRYFILVNGLPRAPSVTVNGQPAAPEFSSATGCAVIAVRGSVRLQIGW